MSDDGYSLLLCMCHARSGALPAIKGMVTLKIRYIIAIGGPTILDQGNGHASILKCTLPCNGLDNLINLLVCLYVFVHII